MKKTKETKELKTELKTKRIKAIYIADIHGDRLFIERLFKEVKERKLNSVVIGGDIVSNLGIAYKKSSQFLSKPRLTVSLCGYFK